jgi:general secretion pathway protein L
MRSIGIDIGSFSVKVAEVESTRTDFNLIALAEFPLTQTPGADHQLEIIEILRKISTTYDPLSTRFVLGMSQGLVSSRFKRFPFRERQKILKSIAFELEDEIPLDLDDAIFDAKIAQYVGNTADVLAFAVPYDIVGAALSRAKDGGLDPEILSTDGVALANLFERWNQPPAQVPAQPVLDLGDGIAPVEPPKPARLILHLGHSRTQLLVYRDDALVAVRSILWGGVEVARSLAQVFSLPASEGVKILKSKSFILMNSLGASKDQVILSQAVSGQVNILVQELKLSLLDLKSEFNISFSGIEMMGPVAQIQNLGAYLTQSLEMPVNMVRSMLVSATFDPGAAVAVGLALEGLKRPRNPALNFRKADFARQNKSLALFWDTWKHSLQIAAVALAAIFIYSIARDTACRQGRRGSDHAG